MTTYSCFANWTWRLRNDLDIECLEIEDLLLEASVTIDGGAITELVVNQVVGRFPTRVGLSWHWLDRELPAWLHERALAAAQAEANVAGTPLAEALAEAARDELDLGDATSSTNPDKED